MARATKIHKDPARVAAGKFAWEKRQAQHQVTQKEKISKLLDLEGVGQSQPEDIYTLTGQEKVDIIQGGTVHHQGPRSLVMYDKQGRASYVTTNNLLGAKAGGLSLTCPNCKGEHANPDDPNGCPALPQLKYAVCPMCGKKVHDDLRGEGRQSDASDDPNRVQIAFQSTAESRIKARVEQHIMVYHERMAQEMGLTRPLQPLGRG